jgi:RNA-binding motif X-linked protein 2
MNTVRNIQKLNEIELANAVPPESSWHTDYRDTAYIYIGGLPYELSEGDIITIFSQFGEPVYIKLVRDKETGKSKGFCFLKYEDQRSTDLAVDNLSGATVMGRILRVDHTRYKKKDDEDEGDNTMPNQKLIDEDNEERRRKKKQRTDETESESEEERPLLPEEIELQKLMRDHDEEDPMKAYMIKQKKEEVEAALKKWKKTHKKDSKHRDSKRRHREDSRDRDRDRRHRHRHHKDRSEDRGGKYEKEKDRSPVGLKSMPERRRSPEEDRRRPRRERSRSREHKRRRSVTPTDSEEEYRRRHRRRSPSPRGTRDRSPGRERDRKSRR